MGDITYTRLQKALRWWFRHEDRILQAFCLIGGAFVLAALIAGCASMPEDLSLQAHEERHCEGETHQQVAGDGQPFIYEWKQTRPASAKPWVYAQVGNPNEVCRLLGAISAGNNIINACAIWRPVNCIIILPRE